MIRDRLIVCVASAWDYDPTSKHHLMRVLSEHNEIVWVDYHGTRRPEASAADARAVWSAIRRFARGPSRVAPSIVQITPLVLPGATRSFTRRLHERMLWSQIRAAVRAVDPRGRRPVQLWTFAPDVPFLCGRLGEECSVYYCVDEYREFDGLDRRRIAEAEDELLRRTDIVVTTSEALHDSRRRQRPDAVLLRHGVDYAHFATAWSAPPPRPADLAEVPRPIFGFFGLIHHWIDHELLAAVARLRPKYSFVLIGDCRSDVSALKRLYNVYLLGRRPYDDLPAYCAGFDAALLPFRRSPMTRNINPIKMYEYLAAGLPVVSTSLPEALRLAGPIAFGDTPEAFAAACDGVLAGEAADRREAISATVRGETWPAKVEELSEIVMGRVNRVLRQRTATLSATAPEGRPVLATVAP